MAQDENTEKQECQNPQEEGKRSSKDTLERMTDEFNRLSRGFIYAGLEAIAVTANMTRSFVEKTSERNSPEKRDSTAKQLANLPMDMTGAFLDVLDESVDELEKVVDKFREKYKEK